ncbi:hypothetical protein DM01DRAFT_1338408 [Hesseltinella vesiculosa]|uniref:Uncharacterized protein n=1 Tax=Hesseltinella vesiculosa TaxID=101127 RepID=A0A1X2G9U2_9FUNG|nr:hypothetical protein DM01DRAFT_1338408 [Hesseltinella vesiculosa]
MFWLPIGTVELFASVICDDATDVATYPLLSSTYCAQVPRSPAEKAMTTSSPSSTPPPKNTCLSPFYRGEHPKHKTAFLPSCFPTKVKVTLQ